MRGILFALSFVSSLVAILGSIDTVGAMDGTHVMASWAWWAVALIFLQLMPPRTVAEPVMPIEAPIVELVVAIETETARVEASNVSTGEALLACLEEIDAANDALAAFFAQPVIEPIKEAIGIALPMAVPQPTVIALPAVTTRMKCQAARQHGIAFEARRRYPTLTAATSANGWLPPSLGLKA